MNGFLAGLGLEGGAISRRLRFVVAALAVGGLLVAIAVVFLAFTAYLALLEKLVPWQAALIVAGGALLIGGILLVLALRSAGETADRVQRAVMTNALAVVAPAAVRLAGRNARLAASLAALAGAVIALWRARKPGPRKES